MSTIQRPLIAALAAVVLAAAACQPIQQQNAPVPTPQASASPMPTPTTAAENTGSAFTMPILAALLHDEDFVKNLRSSLDLTDEELHRLQKTVTDAMADLDENDPGDRSSRAASDKARARISQLLGAERADKLISIVRQRYGGKDALAAGSPNSVPDDSRIVVNIPAYRMDVFKDGKLIKTYKIGIGYPEFPLPTGQRQATEIIFNPTWTPPDEPWVKGKVKPFEKVEAGGKLNPLGPIKIPIGLPSLIHGGKSPAKLGTFASHGCVGLTDGQIKDFALELSSLAGKSIETDELAKYIKDKTETKSVKLPHPIPVELRYETIVIENGVLKIFRDVYEQGTNTEENLRGVLQAFGVSLDELYPGSRKQIMDALAEMQLDASGKPADGVTEDNTNSSRTGSRGTSNSNNVRVTRNVKGRKEVDIKIPQLDGKGYPAPVALRSA
jgi:lipoprotein-anchoring transpeptidase ErfK/SrfK